LVAGPQRPAVDGAYEGTGARRSAMASALRTRSCLPCAASRGVIRKGVARRDQRAGWRCTRASAPCRHRCPSVQNHEYARLRRRPEYGQRTHDAVRRLPA
jgi:hypothetical protein